MRKSLHVKKMCCSEWFFITTNHATGIIARMKSHPYWRVIRRCLYIYRAARAAMTRMKPIIAQGLMMALILLYMICMKSLIEITLPPNISVFPTRSWALPNAEEKMSWPVSRVPTHHFDIHIMEYPAPHAMLVCRMEGFRYGSLPWLSAMSVRSGMASVSSGVVRKSMKEVTPPMMKNVYMQVSLRMA